MHFLIKSSSRQVDRFLAELKPNDTTSEFIDGRVYQKPLPQGTIIQLQTQLWDAINTAAAAQQQAIAYPSQRCSFGGWSIVSDLAMFLNPAPHPWPHTGSNCCPDWMIDILAPGQNSIHVIRAILHGLAHGTQMAWLIDLDNLLILVFIPHGAPYEVKGDHVLPSFPDLDLRLTASQVMSWLPPH